MLFTVLYVCVYAWGKAIKDQGRVTLMMTMLPIISMDMGIIPLNTVSKRPRQGCMRLKGLTVHLELCGA